MSCNLHRDLFWDVARALSASIRQFQTELDDPGVCGGRGNDTERARIEAAARIREVRPVEDIEKLRPEVQAEALPQDKSLLQRKVEVGLSGSARCVAAEIA